MTKLFLILTALILTFTPSFGQSYFTGNPSLDKFLQVLIETDGQPSTQSSLETYGCKINTKANKIWSVQVPASKLNLVRTMPGIVRTDFSTPMVKPTLDDSSRKAVWVNEVHTGSYLPGSYKGKNVVVGVIDVGFDYTHKAFYDANDICRIKRVWEQTKAGTAPAGYNYGRELNSEASIINANFDRSDFTHGTNTAGIAAGSAATSHSIGMAPESDIVLVSLNYGTDDYYSDMNIAPARILDGISYIFNYAKSVGKPAVVNISWGHHAGPHDGTSLLDKAIENLVDSGLMVVVAAGNERGTRLHLSKTLANDTFNTYSVYNDWVYSQLNNSGKPEQNMNDFWGSPNSSFELKLQWRNLSGVVVAETPFMSSSHDSVYDSFLVLGTDSIFYTINTTAENPGNHKPEIFVTFRNKAVMKYRVSYAIAATTEATIHGWNCGYQWQFGYGTFANILNSIQLTKGVAGDAAYTIGESGGNCKSVITVGAYTSNTNWTTNTGNYIDFSDPSTPEGSIAPFSSIGPSVGGAIKPDITAPGYYTGAPHSKFASEMLFTAFVYDKVGTSYYEMTSGTSMAAPVVVGAIALMLEADPKLTHDRIRTILQSTAINDTYTGNAKQNLSPVWGAGKLNTLSAMRSVLNITGLQKKIQQLQFNSYPNPVQNELHISIPNGIKEVYAVQLTDLQGRDMLSQTSAHMDEIIVDMSTLEQGLYFVTVNTGTYKGTRKVLHVK
jgi:minor extracellular serine protease Vpr